MTRVCVACDLDVTSDGSLTQAANQAISGEASGSVNVATPINTTITTPSFPLAVANPHSCRSMLGLAVIELGFALANVDDSDQWRAYSGFGVDTVAFYSTFVNLSATAPAAGNLSIDSAKSMIFTIPPGGNVTLYAAGKMDQPAAGGAVDWSTFFWAIRYMAALA